MKVSVDTTKKKKEEPMTVKKRFLLLLRSLVKNDACVESKSIPWWGAVLLFIFSVLISIVPPVTSSAKEKGSYVITNSTYSMDVGFESFNKFLYDEKIDFYISDKKDGETLDAPELQISDDDVTKFKNSSQVKKYGEYDYYYEYSILNNDSTYTPRFRVFYKPGDKNVTTNRTPAYDFFYSDETFGVSSKNTSEEIKPASFMVLGTHEIFIAVYKPSATKNTEYFGTPFRGDYSRMSAAQTGTGIHLHALMLSTKVGNSDIESVNNFTAETPNWAAVDESRWVGFLNEAYSLTRMNNTLMMFSMLSGLNALIILVYGFTLWILTRGKNNPNRGLKVNETLKISCVAALSPALLSLIIGFIIPSFASMSFIIFTSFRLMWLSMRSLRPMQ